MEIIRIEKDEKNWKFICQDAEGTELSVTIETVSYTHLDVYKRQTSKNCSYFTVCTIPTIQSIPNSLLLMTLKHGLRNILTFQPIFSIILKNIRRRPILISSLSIFLQNNPCKSARNTFTLIRYHWKKTKSKSIIVSYGEIWHQAVTGRSLPMKDICC